MIATLSLQSKKTLCLNFAPSTVQPSPVSARPSGAAPWTVAGVDRGHAKFVPPKGPDVDMHINYKNNKARWPRIIEKTREAPAFIRASVPDHWEAKPSPTRPAPALLLLGGMVCSEACHPQNLLRTRNNKRPRATFKFVAFDTWHLLPPWENGTLQYCFLLSDWNWLNTSWCQLIRDERSRALRNLRRLGRLQKPPWTWISNTVRMK